ncbi:MAG TPA: class I SAM-dependent methyltransferase [Nitrospira sp.]|nr:class I SAM-dependent methyltransferase [Nitrospira sp.]HMU30110.1 class I SAM-dependent methyltransferase [Nitrospira sp.]HMV59538.1 class I SAM-dependent methyltransferase [Nitrospira sp.]HMW84966.1 class I SAM-dependent methyltransferase [Nitrospira sp.]HMX90827.1 class I SAM-dependent methyltransferase [Nitrospira sp.]
MNTLHDIEQFWDANPCGETLVGKDQEWATFFNRYDEFRYRTEGHILGELDRLQLAGKNVLEIGIGQAADSAQIIRRGGRWHGLDLTAEAVFRAKTRFELFQLPYQAVKQGSATAIPYPDKSFDIVYSHGVLHHIPPIRQVSPEIRRVLKPGGKLVIMMYHKHSLNYLVSINIVRRLLMIGLFGLAKIGARPLITHPLLAGHLQNAEEFGLWTYLQNPLFMMRNTDGPGNPYSKVYDAQDIAADFAEFRLENTRVHFLNERHLPVLKLLPPRVRTYLASKLGWHLWATLG